MFNLREIQEILIAHFELLEFDFSNEDKIKSYRDSKLFKELYIKFYGKLIPLTSFLDGVQVSKNSKQQLWLHLFKNTSIRY